MTMLDTMRRHKGWLKWTLALVCFAFVIFLVPDLYRGLGAGPALSNAVATVNGTPITAGEYQRVLTAQMQRFRGSGGTMSESMLKQLGIDRQVLQGLIDDRAISAEARRLGLTVTDSELREFILSMPALQENGQFMGYDRYRALLRSQRPPLSVDEFEEAVRRELLGTKLQDAVTGWMTLGDAEVDEEYRRRNEKVKLAVVRPVPRWRDRD
jgi:peptidyl-prolyl cis-trans isomerase D